MYILVTSIVLAVCGFLTSPILIGIFPSIIAFCLSIYCVVQKKTINRFRTLFVSLTGIIVPIIMYLNCYGFSLPYDKGMNLPVLTQIIYDNYSNMGLDMSFLIKNDEEPDVISEPEIADDEDIVSVESTPENSGDMYYVNNLGKKEETEADTEDSLDYRDYPETVFEKFKDLEKEYDTKPESKYVAASDDDMPSYGGLPLGTMLIAQYFREDDHNCNPVLILQNKTGDLNRYECIFTARDEEGNEISVSERTSEVVPDGAKFVMEGRFNKSELNGKLPSMYEFTVSKYTPYEKDMTDQVTVQTMVSGNSVIVAADNTSDIKVKVDAYILFFDGEELVDCIWLIPNNVDDVCISPGSLASIKGDAYYKFDRIETYYTAYEAIESDE